MNKSLEYLTRVLESYGKCLVIGNKEEPDKLSAFEMAYIKNNIEKYIKSLNCLKNHFMLVLETDGYSYWIESPLLGNVKSLITEEEYRLLGEMLENEIKEN
jgi:hypothetical protein